MTSTWTPQSWREHTALQQPQWDDPTAVVDVLKQLEQRPPLVFAGEADSLTNRLAAVCNGEAFLLQAGDCAESFDTPTNSIRDRLKVILQMAVVLTYSSGVPTVKVGRIAGQYAKPRSSDTETVEGTELPSFRGHIVNSPGFSEGERRADPHRLLDAYNHSAATLNLVRAFTTGGYAALSEVHSWNQQFVAASPAGQRYEALASEIDRAMRFMAACGLDGLESPELSAVEFYTSHEALLLGYEQALTRQDSRSADAGLDKWYDCSAHMLWIGERTRELDGAHIEFLRGVENPLGCKIGPTATVDEVLALCETLNPERIPGRLTLISRMGADSVTEHLEPLLVAVRDAGHPVVWACDPMHGNTFTAPGGHKTRHFDEVLREISGFFGAHRRAGTWPGGVHIELTGDDVTECLGGADDLSDAELGERYETMCDPRLNGRQSVELAFRVAELLRAEAE